MITLRQFLSIAPNIIETYLCYVYVYTIDKKWGCEECKQVKTVRSINDLDEFLDDYYIEIFDQTVVYGEIESQDIYLRKIKDYNNKGKESE